MMAERIVGIGPGNPCPACCADLRALAEQAANCRRIGDTRGEELAYAQADAVLDQQHAPMVDA